MIFVFVWPTSVSVIRLRSIQCQHSLTVVAKHSWMAVSLDWNTASWCKAFKKLSRDRTGSKHSKKMKIAYAPLSWADPLTLPFPQAIGKWIKCKYSAHHLYMWGKEINLPQMVGRRHQHCITGVLPEHDQNENNSIARTNKYLTWNKRVPLRRYSNLKQEGNISQLFQAMAGLNKNKNSTFYGSKTNQSKSMR